MQYRWSLERRTAPLLLIFLIWLTGSLVLCQAASAETAPPAQGQVLIVSSSDNPFFRRSIQRIEERLQPRSGGIIRLLSKDLDEQREQLTQAALIITLGARAMRRVSRLNAGPPLLHAYLTRYQYHADPPLKGSHSLLLDQPLQRYLRFDRLLTGAGRVGLLTQPDSAFDPQQLEALARREGIEVQQTILQANHGNPVAAVRQILQKNDNLLALPSPDIYNRRTLKGILLAAYRLRKPVISYSQAHVRAGALGALYATPEQIGEQIAELAGAWLDGKAPEQDFTLARYFTIDINQRVASALDIQLPNKDELHQAIESSQPQ